MARAFGTWKQAAKQKFGRLSLVINAAIPSSSFPFNSPCTLIVYLFLAPRTEFPNTVRVIFLVSLALLTSCLFREAGPAATGAPLVPSELLLSRVFALRQRRVGPRTNAGLLWQAVLSLTDAEQHHSVFRLGLGVGHSLWMADGGASRPRPQHAVTLLRHTPRQWASASSPAFIPLLASQLRAWGPGKWQAMRRTPLASQRDSDEGRLRMETNDCFILWYCLPSLPRSNQSLSWARCMELAGAVAGRCLVGRTGASSGSTPSRLAPT